MCWCIIQYYIDYRTGITTIIMHLIIKNGGNVDNDINRVVLVAQLTDLQVVVNEVMRNHTMR